VTSCPGLKRRRTEAPGRIGLADRARRSDGADARAPDLLGDLFAAEAGEVEIARLHRERGGVRGKQCVTRRVGLAFALAPAALVGLAGQCDPVHALGPAEAVAANDQVVHRSRL